MDELEQAIEFIGASDTNSALKVLVELLKKDPRNEIAWLLLANCLPDVGKKRYCLKKALEINPGNQEVLQLLSTLETSPLSKKP